MAAVAGVAIVLAVLPAPALAAATVGVGQMALYQVVQYLQVQGVAVVLPICSGRHTLQGLVVVPVAVLAA